MKGLHLVREWHFAHRMMRWGFLGGESGVREKAGNSGGGEEQ